MSVYLRNLNADILMLNQRLRITNFIPDGLIEIVKSLDEELHVILVDQNNNSEADDKFEELNKRLEELQKQKPKVIIKEVEKPTKKKKLF